jgi:[NiFe] hydrogenase diaphorase moiety small subunit
MNIMQQRADHHPAGGINMRKIKRKIKAGKKSTGKVKTKSAMKARARNKSRVRAKSISKPRARKISKPKVKSMRKTKGGGAVKTRGKIKAASPKLIRFEIDGKEYTAKAGLTIVEAARANGIYIPVLCYYKGMIPAGICRICTVKVSGRNMAACTTPVAQGMIIENDIPELEEMRKALVEMLFVEGNHMCPTCEKSGNCELQALGYRYKMLVPRFPYQFPNREIDATYSKIMIDNNRCIQCRRCVRGIMAKDGRHIFAMTNRSGRSTIVADRALEAKMSDATAKKAMDQCPVGAILKKGVGFAVPIGSRKYDKTPIGSEIQK